MRRTLVWLFVFGWLDGRWHRPLCALHGMPYSLGLQCTALLIKMGSHGLLHPLAGIRLLRAGFFSLVRTSGLTFVRPGGSELRRSAPFLA